MGWTEYRLRDFKSIKHYVESFNINNENRLSKVLDYAVVNRTELYAAIDYTDKETEERKVWALVVQFRFTKTTVAYKDMDETMGPYLYNCPERILKLLTTTTNQHANDWREHCRQKHRISKSCIMREGQVYISKGYDNVIKKVTLVRPLTNNKNGSWLGINQDGKQYRYSRQWLVKNGFTTEEFLFDNNL